MGIRVLSVKNARRDRRFKDTFRGRIKYQGASYLCLVDDISQNGLHLLSGAAVHIGDRMNVRLQLSQDVELSCVIEVRHVTEDGLGAKIAYISKADACILTDRIEEHRYAQVAYTASDTPASKCPSSHRPERGWATGGCRPSPIPVIAPVDRSPGGPRS